MAKTTYKIGNWSAYNEALRERGRLTVWISEEAIDGWKYRGGPPQQGAQPVYSDLAIETCLTIGLVYGDLPYRQTQGFVASLFRLMDIDLPVPDYSTLSRRQEDLSISLCAGGSGGSGQKDEPGSENSEGKHIVIDPQAGLKVYGEGEWKQRQHGNPSDGPGALVHISVDAETGEITAETLTENSEHDALQAGALLGRPLSASARSPASEAMGPYDTFGCYEAISEIDAKPIIPPQRNAKIREHGNCKGEPLARDEAIRYIRGHGRAKWKRVCGYHLRSLAEAVMRRFKTLIGRTLSARKLTR